MMVTSTAPSRSRSIPVLQVVANLLKRPLAHTVLFQQVAEVHDRASIRQRVRQRVRQSQSHESLHRLRFVEQVIDAGGRSGCRIPAHRGLAASPASRREGVPGPP